MTTLGFQAYCRQKEEAALAAPLAGFTTIAEEAGGADLLSFGNAWTRQAVRRRFPSLRRARLAGTPGREPGRDAGRRSRDAGDHGRGAGRRVRRHGAAPAARRPDAGRRGRGARRHGPRQQRQPDLFRVASGAGEAARRAGPAAASGAGAGDQLLPGRVRSLPAVPGAVAADHRGDARQPRGRGAVAPPRLSVGERRGCRRAARPAAGAEAAARARHRRGLGRRRPPRRDARSSMPASSPTSTSPCANPARPRRRWRSTTARRSCGGGCSPRPGVARRAACGSSTSCPRRSTRRAFGWASGRPPFGVERRVALDVPSPLDNLRICRRGAPERDAPEEAHERQPEGHRRVERGAA